MLYEGAQDLKYNMVEINLAVRIALLARGSMPRRGGLPVAAVASKPPADGLGVEKGEIPRILKVVEGTVDTVQVC